MSDLLVRGGTLVTVDGPIRADVRCRGGRVVEVGLDLPPAGEPVFDASGALVFPGIIDPHVHFALVAEPHRTADDFATGSAAALAGGVTTFIDFAHQRAGERLESVIDARLVEAAVSRADYSLHIIVTDISGDQLAELPALTARGFTSAKIYTTYRPAGFYCDDHTALRLMTAAAEHGWVVLVHCENDDIVEAERTRIAREGRVAFRYHGVSRPAIAEIEAVQRMILFAEETGCATYLVHLSTAAAARAVGAARDRGAPVVGETCPQFLMADETVYDTERAARFIHTPPLRTDADRRALWEALGGGIQTVASDHCGYTLQQRTDYGDLTQVAPGIPGVETLFPLLYTYGYVQGTLSLADLVRLCCVNPARVFGLYPHKGSLAPGADADLVIYDPAGETTLSDAMVRSAAGYSPFSGTTLRGRVAATILRGKIAFDGADVVAEPGQGRLVPRRPVMRSALP